MINTYLDTANVDTIQRASGLISGFTTNPSIIKAAGVTDYESFVKDACVAARGLPISFEVIADDFIEMERQARKLSALGNNVYVKIPIINTKEESCVPLIKKLSDDGIKCNITAVFTMEQVRKIIKSISHNCEAIISVFAGRIADLGEDPSKIIKRAVRAANKKPNIKILWASPREILNIYQADDCGCHIITVTKELFEKKASLCGIFEGEYCLQTVEMFYNDAIKANFQL